MFHTVSQTKVFINQDLNLLSLENQETQDQASQVDSLKLKLCLKTKHEYLSPDGLCSFYSKGISQIACAGTEGLISIYNPFSKEITELNCTKDGQVESRDFALCITVNGDNLLLTADAHGKIEIWKCEQKLKSLRTFDGHKSHIISLNYIPYLRAIVSTGTDRKLLIWSPLNLKTLFSRTFEGNFPVSTCSLENTNQIVVGFSSGEISVLDVQGSKHEVKLNEVASIKGHDEHVVSLAHASKGNLLISASNDGFVKIWRMTAKEGLECVKQIFESKGHIRHAVFLEDRDLLLMNCWTGYIKLWKVSEERKIDEKQDDTFGLAFTALDTEGQFATGVNLYGELKVWEIKK